MTITELISLVDLNWSAEFIQKHKSVGLNQFRNTNQGQSQFKI